tara:strand:+ start:5089 stop:5808 length:720 start_codon:yes stop_codon:yes gene_type:complete
MGVHYHWASTTEGIINRLLFFESSNIFNNYIIFISMTLKITLISWLMCLAISSILAVLSYNNIIFQKVIKLVVSFTNIHIFGGFLIIYFFYAKNDLPIPQSSFLAIFLVVFCNGTLKTLVEKFRGLLNTIFDQQYVQFAKSQGISKWVSANQQIKFDLLETALEILPFFLINSIIAELAFDGVKGLGSEMLNTFKATANNGNDNLDIIFLMIFSFVFISRLATFICDEFKNNINKINVS